MTIKTRKKPETKPRVVCPACYKSCALFKRLMKFKYTDDEKRAYFANYHRDVCPRCKSLLKNGKLREKCRDQLCKVRDLGETRIVPEWAQ